MLVQVYTSLRLTRFPAWASVLLRLPAREESGLLGRRGLNYRGRFTVRQLSFAVTALVLVAACDNAGPTSPTQHATTKGPPAEAAPIINLLKLPLLPSKYKVGVHAVALSANVLGIAAKAGEAGPTGPGGGSEKNSALTVTIPNLLWTSVLNGEVWANQYHSFAASSIDELKLKLPGILELYASVLASKAAANCGGGPVTGNSSIAKLVINGQPIVITGQPNQTIWLGIAKIVINEQQPFYNGIRVRALHVEALGVADVVVAESAAPLFSAPC